MVLFTLREMAKGGMNDQLGGGFHRYSVDANGSCRTSKRCCTIRRNSQSRIWRVTRSQRESRIAQVARDIFEYVLRDMTDASGGFYSAEDADSVIDPAKSDRKGRRRILHLESGGDRRGSRQNGSRVVFLRIRG